MQLLSVKVIAKLLIGLLSILAVAYAVYDQMGATASQFHIAIGCLIFCAAYEAMGYALSTDKKNDSFV